MLCMHAMQGTHVSCTHGLEQIVCQLWWLRAAWIHSNTACIANKREHPCHAPGLRQDIAYRRYRGTRVKVSKKQDTGSAAPHLQAATQVATTTAQTHPHPQSQAAAGKLPTPGATRHVPGGPAVCDMSEDSSWVVISNNSIVQTNKTTHTKPQQARCQHLCLHDGREGSDAGANVAAVGHVQTECVRACIHGTIFGGGTFIPAGAHHGECAS